jgi:hypothetical protein
MYTCPVCGYDRLRRPPEDYLICPSCGTEFGYSDATASYRELRQRWLYSGARWYSQVTPEPPKWNAYQQLRRAGSLDIERKTLDDEPSISVVDFGRTQADVGQGVSLYTRLIAIGNSGTELMKRAHYATA